MDQGSDPQSGHGHPGPGEHPMRRSDAVVRAVKGEAQEAERLGHAHLTGQAEDEREPRFDVEMSPAEGVLDGEGAAVALELQPIEVAVACPDAIPGGVALQEESASLRER